MLLTIFIYNEKPLQQNSNILFKINLSSPPVTAITPDMCSRILIIKYKRISLIPFSKMRYIIAQATGYLSEPRFEITSLIFK